MSAVKSLHLGLMNLQILQPEGLERGRKPIIRRNLRKLLMTELSCGREIQIRILLLLQNANTFE